MELRRKASRFSPAMRPARTPLQKFDLVMELSLWFLAFSTAGIVLGRELGWIGW